MKEYSTPIYARTLQQTGELQRLAPGDPLLEGGKNNQETQNVKSTVIKNENIKPACPHIHKTLAILP